MLMYCVQVRGLESTLKQKSDEIEIVRRERQIVEETYRRQLASVFERPPVYAPQPAYASAPVTIERPDRATIAELVAEQQKTASQRAQIDALQAQINALQGRHGQVNDAQSEVEHLRKKNQKLKVKLATEAEAFEVRERQFHQQLYDMDAGWQERERAWDERLGQAQVRVTKLEAEMHKFGGLTDKDLDALCVDLESMCEELRSATPGTESYVPAVSGDFRVRLNHYLTFIQARTRSLVRERAKFKEALRGIEVDKQYLATELQNKHDQLRRLTQLHAAEKASLLNTTVPTGAATAHAETVTVRRVASVDSDSRPSTAGISPIDEVRDVRARANGVVDAVEGARRALNESHDWARRLQHGDRVAGRMDESYAEWSERLRQTRPNPNWASSLRD